MKDKLLLILTKCSYSYNILDIYISYTEWLTINKDVFSHEWDDSSKIFTSGSFHEWKFLVNLLISDQKFILHGKPYIILLLTWSYGCKNTEIHENSHQSITAPLLFMMGQSIVVLWCHANTYCDVILTSCPQNVSKLVTFILSTLWSWLSLINYHVKFMVFRLSSM